MHLTWPCGLAILAYSVFLCITVIMFLNRKLFYRSLITMSTITSSTWCPTNHEEPKNRAPYIPSNKTMYKILLWTWRNSSAFRHLSEGQKTFIDKGCHYTNCYITWDTRRNHTEFDVIAFDAQDTNVKELPRERKLHQKYAFASVESPAYYPLTSAWNGFFNWTWTYHLDSDARWGFIVVRDISGRVVGPRKEMHWIKWEDMAPVSQSFKNSLRTKTKAAAWLVTNCKALNKREDYVQELEAELQEKYNLTVDIFGPCGDYQCGSKVNQGPCYDIIEKDYFFYLAFENSFCEDYVTEKILHGLNTNTIPIVYGTANYTRFMPDGSYLHAGRMLVTELAPKMNELIRDEHKYAEYFKWKNHYRYDDSAEDKPCDVCALLNDENKVRQTTIYHDIETWWNSQRAPASQYKKFYRVTY